MQTPQHTLLVLPLPTLHHNAIELLLTLLLRLFRSSKRLFVLHDASDIEKVCLLFSSLFLSFPVFSCLLLSSPDRIPQWPQHLLISRRSHTPCLLHFALPRSLSLEVHYVRKIVCRQVFHHLLLVLPIRFTKPAASNVVTIENLVVTTRGSCKAVVSSFTAFSTHTSSDHPVKFRSSLDLTLAREPQPQHGESCYIGSYFELQVRAFMFFITFLTLPGTSSVSSLSSAWSRLTHKVVCYLVSVGVLGAEVASFHRSSLTQTHY